MVNTKYNSCPSVCLLCRCVWHSLRFPNYLVISWPNYFVSYKMPYISQLCILFARMALMGGFGNYLWFARANQKWRQHIVMLEMTSEKEICWKMLFSENNTFHFYCFTNSNLMINNLWSHLLLLLLYRNPAYEAIYVCCYFPNKPSVKLDRYPAPR